MDAAIALSVFGLPAFPWARRRTHKGDGMNLERAIHAIRVADLTARTRSEAIRVLVESVDWDELGVSAQRVFQAVEEREAAAETIIADDLAMPHAVVDWDGEPVVVLGRSRAGIEYGAAGNRIFLVLLVVTPRDHEVSHVRLLAEMARLLEPREFRQAIVEADGIEGMKALLRERRARLSLDAEQRIEKASLLSEAIVEHALRLVDTCRLQTLLVTLDPDTIVPWRPLVEWKGRLLLAVRSSQLALPRDRPDTHVLDLPNVAIASTDRVSLGLLLATASGLVDHDADVVCLTGLDTAQLDCVMVAKPTVRFGDILSDQLRARCGLQPAVMLRIISLAIEIAAEGREGQPRGTLFVLGDSPKVRRRARQLVLNPFHGFARGIRNVLDPSLSETIKEFAMLDGAFVVEADGTLASAGTYLLPTKQEQALPGGLGTRHQAAAAITAETRAIAIVVSQSTGKVTVFQRGRIVLSLDRPSVTRW